MASVQRNSLTALVVTMAQIPEQGLRLQVDIMAASLHLPQLEELEFLEPIHVQGLLTKVSEQIYFQGALRGAVMVRCGRCLEQVHNDLTIDLRAMFLAPADFGETEDAEEPDLADELDVYGHDGWKLDLTSAVRDQVVLALPIQPLCRPECAGLCQICGSNRNEASCTCQSEQGDPRFALLKQLSFPESP